jgi:DNA ligase 1
MQTLPMLFKANSRGSLQQWRIWTEGSKIKTEFGEIGGKLQIAEDTIKTGKNLGKKNATTPEQQAEAEALSKWEKQKSKKGYVEDKERAAAEENDLEGEECMLAQEYGILLNGVFIPASNKKIKFPAALQPKLNGHRCRTKPDKTLWSRGHKPILSVPHIVRDLTLWFTKQAPKLDGELYSHEFRETLEDTSSIVRQSKEVHADHEKIKYHVYDVDEPGLTFRERMELLEEIINRLSYEKMKNIVLVPTIIVNSHEEVIAAMKKFTDEGYEGVMVRNLEGLYEGKRSYDLQKFKEFFEQEFDIVDIEEGRGKLQGHVGAFWCMTADGERFKVKMEGKTAKLKECFENHALWKGKKMTVSFKGWTKYKVPHGAVAVQIREDI